MFTTVPGATSAAAAVRRLASTTSPTKVKLRTCEPSPSSGNAGPPSAASHRRWKDMSGRWAGPVDGEVPQRHGRHVPRRRVQPTEVLGRQLGHTVRTARLREDRSRPWDIARPRRTPTSSTRTRTGRVDVRGRLRAAAGSRGCCRSRRRSNPSAHERRTPGWPAGGTRRRRRRAAASIATSRRSASAISQPGRAARRSRFASFLADVVVVGQAIDDANGVTSVEESLDEMRSDEAGSAGDERADE